VRCLDEEAVADVHADVVDAPRHGAAEEDEVGGLELVGGHGHAHRGLAGGVVR
jgi:hypothetical protein